MSGLDYPLLVGVGLFLALNLAAGLFARSRIENAADFIVAGRRLPLWLATATLFATWFGGGTCIGAAGAAYREGVTGVIADPFGAALCLFLAGAFFARPLRRTGLMTIGDFFRQRFGRSAELISSLLQAPPFIGWAAAQFVAFGAVLHVLAGVDQTLAIFAGALVVLVYGTTGGMWAIAYTDFLQALALAAGLLYLLPLAVEGAGGAQAILTALPEGRLDVLPENSWIGWVWYVQAWTVIGLGSIPSQDLLQRSLSARDEHVAVRSAYLSGFFYLTIGLIPVALGLIASVTLPSLGDPEQALPQLGKLYLGPGGQLVFTSALLAAILSSADSSLLAPASVVAQNIVKPLRPGLSEAASLRLTRWTFAVSALLALGLALRFRNVYGLMLGAMEAGVAGLIAPFAAGIYWRRVDQRAANASMISGALTWALLSLVQATYPADLAGMAVSAAVLAALTLAPRKSTS